MNAFEIEEYVIGLMAYFVVNYTDLADLMKNGNINEEDFVMHVSVLSTFITKEFMDKTENMINIKHIVENKELSDYVVNQAVRFRDFVETEALKNAKS